MTWVFGLLHIIDYTNKAAAHLASTTVFRHSISQMIARTVEQSSCSMLFVAYKDPDAFSVTVKTEVKDKASILLLGSGHCKHVLVHVQDKNVIHLSLERLSKR